MKIKAVEDLTLFEVNKMSITLIKNVESQYQIKHIDVQYYYIRELVNEKELIVVWFSR